MPHTHDAILDPTDPVSPLSIPGPQTALLLLDYHTFIFSRVPAGAGPTILSATSLLRTWALAHNALIIHCLLDTTGPIQPTFKGLARITSMQSTLHATPESSASTAEHPGIAPPGTNTVYDGRKVLKVSENEYVVKRQMGKIGALKSEGLVELLREKVVRSLVLGGLSTSGCVAATARPAADEGWVVTVVGDACADPKEGVHEMVLEAVVSSQAHVCTAEEWVGAWKRKEEGGK